MTCESCGKPLDDQSQFCSGCGRPNGNKPHRDGDEPTFVPVRLSDVLEGKWRLEKKIGEGGMGTVYLATDLQLDRPVAVKILASSLVGDQEVVARFEREAKVTASLEHPNVVPVYAVGRYEGRPFMVMKKLEGETLSALIREKGTLTLDETLYLFEQLASGIDFIHSKGYVHRDIKAGNIFVGPDGHATILDFGILRPANSGEALTRTGMVMGTPQYISPEQALGTREVDHRADLYALAVVLFECLTGTLPFEADSELKLIQMHAHMAPPDITERAPWLSRAVAEVVKRALAKRPEDRYPTASELVAALAAAARPSDAPEVPPGASTALSWRKRSSGEKARLRLSGEHRAISPLPSAPPADGKLGPDTAALARSVKPNRAWLWPSAALLAVAAALSVWAAREPKAEAAEVPAAVEPLGEPPALAQSEDAGEGDAEGEPVAAEEDAGFPPLDLAAQPVPDAGTPAKKKKGAPKPGYLRVLTLDRGEVTWAEVTVNGIQRRTPTTISLPAGRHRVRVERTGFRPQEREIKVASGRTEVLQINLVR